MYKVSGYDWFCNEYVYETNHFVDAIRYYLCKKEIGDTVIISGISDKKKKKIW